MDRLISYLRAHATSLGSYAAVILTVASTLLASGVIGPDTTAYHLIGYVAAVLTALGFKALPASSNPPPALERPVSGCGDQVAAICRHRARGHRAGMAGERGQRAAGYEFPDIERSVLGRGDHVAAIRRHRAPIHLVGVACERGERAPGRQLPDLERVTGWAR